MELCVSAVMRISGGGIEPDREFCLTRGAVTGPLRNARVLRPFPDANRKAGHESAA